MERSVEGTEVDFHLLSEDTGHRPLLCVEFEDKLPFSRPSGTQVNIFPIAPRISQATSLLPVKSHKGGLL